MSAKNESEDLVANTMTELILFMLFVFVLYISIANAAGDPLNACIRPSDGSDDPPPLYLLRVEGGQARFLSLDGADSLQTEVDAYERLPALRAAVRAGVMPAESVFEHIAAIRRDAVETYGEDRPQPCQVYASVRFSEFASQPAAVCDTLGTTVPLLRQAVIASNDHLGRVADYCAMRPRVTTTERER